MTKHARVQVCSQACNTHYTLCRWILCNTALHQCRLSRQLIPQPVRQTPSCTIPVRAVTALAPKKMRCCSATSTQPASLLRELNPEASSLHALRWPKFQVVQRQTNRAAHPRPTCLSPTMHANQLSQVHQMPTTPTASAFRGTLLFGSTHYLLGNSSRPSIGIV